MAYELEIVYPRRTGLSQPAALAGAYRWPYQLIAHCRRLKRFVIVPVEVQIWYREPGGSQRELLYRFRLLPPVPIARAVGEERQPVTSRRDVAPTHPSARGERSRFIAFP
uniref:Uncharacterized protein n=1 Tax=Thermogemmatispora argillosa TaxID=2045280 RepID=A0A455SZL2_9CHLR|nr:hypothetical protein KTA_13290 [Thermogemmatispora argillosa]